MDEKMIRFIDSNYKELFTIPDGGAITMTYANGVQEVGVCKYLNSDHFELLGSQYSKMHFAMLMESNGVKVEPEKEPEMVGSSYRVMRRIPVGNKVYVLGHSPTAPQPYATWQAYRDVSGKDFGHYWSNLKDARTDLRRRAEAEHTGIPYDHTKAYKQKTRDDAR